MRFIDQPPGPYVFVPQGGGRPLGHRCPGEDLALQLLAGTVRALSARQLDVCSPLRVDLARTPTLPVDGLRLSVA